MDSYLDLSQQFAAWKEFISYQKIAPMIDTVIANSWKRCWARLNPNQIIRLNNLSPDHLLAAQVASFDLISVARPVMEDIHQFMEYSSTALLLTNGAGYILDSLGDGDMLDIARRKGVNVGHQFSEYQMGTNAFSLALLERIPSRVVGAEHYLQQFHDLAEVAAPIFDLTGRPLGVLGLICLAKDYSPHTIGLTVAGARAVESQRQADYLLAEQNSHLAQLNAILAAISDGILVWDANRILMHINTAAANMIGLAPHGLLGLRIGDMLNYPSFIQDALAKQEPLTDVEANIRIDNRTVSCILSLKFVHNSNKELKWIIVMLRQEKDVRKLVQNQFGAQALLTLEDIPGESQPIRRVHRLVKSAAPAQASILVRGESGTGKNVLANAIHNESPRRDGPFLIFACSTVANELIASELLGYEEGMSSKRPGGRPSKFELAHGGTLFFQDIDALPLEAQAILLNVLDLGIVQRLGSDRPITVDVRIIAASSANMEKLVAQGSFRADLFYRLSTFEITLPPLRERQKDMPMLVERILKRLTRQLNHPLSLAPEVLEILQRYNWPGNVRELEAVLGRAAVQAGTSELIGPMHLPEVVLHPVNGMEADAQGMEIRSLDQMERDAIREAAHRCGGNITEMARLLNIGRTTVWRKLKAYDIDVEDYRIKGITLAS